MPDQEPGAGPNQDAGSQSQAGGRAEGGRNPSSSGTGETPQNPNPDIAVLQSQLALEKQNAAASARQEQVNRQQLQSQAVKMQQLEQTIQNQYTQQQSNDDGEVTAETAAERLKRAMYDDDVAGIAGAVEDITSIGARRGREEASIENEAQIGAQQRRHQVGQYFAPHQESLNNPSDPVTARALELYGQMDAQHQNGQFMNWVPNDTIPIQIAPGVNHQVNIHLLKEAHQRAAVEVASGTAPARVADIQPEYLEPSGRGTAPVPRGAVPNVEDLLSEDDRTAAVAYWDGEPDATEDEKYQDYFDNFSAPIKAARRKLGRPVSSTDLISAGIMDKG